MFSDLGVDAWGILEGVGSFGGDTVLWYTVYVCEKRQGLRDMAVVRLRGLEDGIRSGALVELPSQTLGHTNPNLHFLYPEPKTPKPLNLKPQTLNP